MVSIAYTPAIFVSVAHLGESFSSACPVGIFGKSVKDD
jgi:hypothetical protein